MFIIDELKFSIANVNFLYQYYPNMSISEDSAIFNFISNIKDMADVKNSIYILPSNHLKIDVEKNGDLISETPVWKNYLFDGKAYYLFSPNGESDVALLEVQDSSFSNMKTYVYKMDFSKQPLPICVTGLILQQKLFYNNTGFLMHGATINLNNKGIILTGNSGVGKSTLSKLFTTHADCEQITDDRFILSKHENGYLSYGNPLDFKIERNKNKSIPIKKIFFLSHGDKNSIKQLSYRDALNKLITISLLPYWDREKLNICIKEIESIAHKIECFDFSFFPDESAVDFLVKDI